MEQRGPELATRPANPEPADGVRAAESPGAAVTLKNVRKEYNDSIAVHDVSLDIEPGEFVTLLGPSGSGKTTTLNMIAGFTDLTAGEILMDKTPINSRPPHRRNVGMVFQHYALFPHMTAAENLAFPLKQRKVRKQDRERRIRDTLALVGLGDQGNRYPRQLSGGQQQRVALARAIVFHPRVLLMDEPLGALDKKLREWLQLEIKRIHREVGITFLYVTHDQDEALALSDRIAVFRDGRIDQLGTPDQLYEHPRTLFVAEFLGESNVFRGRVDQAGGVCTLQSGQYVVRARSHSAATAAFDGSVVVRPERILIAPESDSLPQTFNALSGTVTSVVYLGAGRRVEVALASGMALVVREQAGRLSTTVAGDCVHVSWSPDDCFVIPQEDD